MFAFVEMLAFVVLIMAGFFFVWKKGVLDWAHADRDLPVTPITDNVTEGRLH
jgi:NADH-quinone oxidoreductase subunit A